LYNLNFEAYALDLGSRVNLIAPAIGMDIWTRIVSVRRGLSDPMDVQATVSDPEAGGGVQGPDLGKNDPTDAEPPSLEDVIESIERRLQRLEGDTGVVRTIEDLINADLEDVAAWDTTENVGNLPELMEDILTDASPAADVTDYRNALQDFIEDFIEDLIPDTSDAAGLPVTSTAGTIGTSDQWAKQDHTHQGMPWRSAGTKEGLDALLAEGEVGHTTGTKRLYCKIDAVTICLSHLETV
jgi:hypothetical protein